jgi:glucuronoarabinoxylan endo-1,4-beta-xylanase
MMSNPAISLRIVLVGFLLNFLVPESGNSATVILDVSKRYQTIEGFGGGFMYGVWPYGRQIKDELYDSIFKNAGCNIIRIANNYDPQAGNAVDEIPMMKDVQEKFPQVKIFMASWSPPKYLKDRDTIVGILDNEKLSLKKTDGKFVYDQYADYWYQSIKHFQDSGLKISWASIQNEPDWPAAWEGCYFVPVETDKIAAYGTALDAVYNKVQPLNIPLIGPDMTGPAGVGFSLSQYMGNLNQAQLFAICHHYYSGATESAMRQVRQQFPDKLVYQTEWLTNDTIPLWDGGPTLTWFDHINVIQDALTIENVSMYLLFALAYKPTSRHCFFSLDSTASGGFTTRPMYYAFKHFSKSIHRGWQRIGTTVSTGADSLRVSAFAGNNDSAMSIVIINRNGKRDSVKLMGVPAAIDSGLAHQTTRMGNSGFVQLKKYSLNAVFGKSIPTINLDPYSITTVALYNTKYSEPPEEKLGLNPVFPQHRPSFLHISLSAKVQRNHEIRLSFQSVPNTNYRISFFDFTGRLVMGSPVFRATGRFTIRTIKGPCAGGTYSMKVESAKTVQNEVVVIP